MQNPNFLPEQTLAVPEVESETNAPALPPAVPSTSWDRAATTTNQPRSKPLRRHPRAQQQEQRLLMRRWLLKLADDGDIPGLEWIDKNDRTLLRIPWCHGSRLEWNQDHALLFKAWAEHKGLL